MGLGRGAGEGRLWDRPNARERLGIGAASIELASEPFVIELAAVLVGLWAVACWRPVVGVRRRNFLGVSFVRRTRLQLACLMVGGSRTERQLNGAAFAEEPANGADAEALLDKVGLLQLQGQLQPGLLFELFLEKWLEAEAQD